MPHALIVDDDPQTREALGALTAAEGFSVAAAADLREARIQLTRQQPDVLLIDVTLPDGSGLDLIPEVERGTDTEIILITGNASVETAVKALRVGAADYLTTPVNVARLRSVLSRVPRPADLKAEIGTLRSELRRLGRFGNLLGNSPAMHRLYDQILRVAATEATVLLIGESGTGKELAAQTLHELSRRRGRPFLGVNCGALSSSEIESELFGYIERADGGTLFIDEVTGLPIPLQARLLGVLEGAQTDVRVLAATHRDPEAALADGTLRTDLYHRLNVFPLHLPPLRERAGDVALLAQHFLDELNRIHATHKALPAATLDQLAAHPWPGNVRELRNWVQRAYILADEALDADVLPAGGATPQQPSGPMVSIPVGTSLAEADKKLILATLEQCRGVKTQSAELLGISVKTLYNRLGEYRQEVNSNGRTELPVEH
jgi:DNA-binding NtrC family response regulator